MAMNNNNYASGAGGGKSSRPRPVSLGGSLGLQLSALGLVGGGGGGGGGGGSKAGGKSGRPQSIDLRRASSAGNDAMGLESSHLETPQQRWAMPRRRLRHGHDGSGGGSLDVSNSSVGATDGIAMRSSRGGGKRARPRTGWAPGFLKSPTLGGLRAGVVGKTAKARSKSTSSAVPISNGGGAGARAKTPSGSVDSSCASTVRAGEEASSTADTPRFVPPALASSGVLCGLPAGLELSPTALGATLVATGLPSEE